jgi:hypothetical protein
MTDSTNSVLWTALIDNSQGPIGANCFITLTVNTSTNSTNHVTKSKTAATTVHSSAVTKQMVLTLNLGSTDSLILYTRNGEQSRKLVFIVHVTYVRH